VNQVPLLYSFRRCPYAMRARMALAVSGIAYELMEVSLRNKPDGLIAASPKATVPVLVLADGSVIDESLEIMHWALTQHDPEKWLVSTDTDLMATFDGPFKGALDRYKYPTRFEGVDPIEQRAAGLIVLQNLNQRIGHQPYLHGSHYGLTDIAIFPFIRQYTATDSAWFAAQNIPHVQRWLTSLVSSDLFRAVIKV
jgi:glutathione S-transferase